MWALLLGEAVAFGLVSGFVTQWNDSHGLKHVKKSQLPKTRFCSAKQFTYVRPCAGRDGCEPSGGVAAAGAVNSEGRNHGVLASPTLT